MTRRRQALSTGLMALVLARLDARAQAGAAATGMAPAAAQRLDALDAKAVITARARVAQGQAAVVSGQA